MLRIKIIFNPVAGKGEESANIDELALTLLDRNYMISKFTTKQNNDAFNEAFKTALSEEWDLIISAGGDGTLNEVINGIIKSGNPIHLAVYPIGTMNDFGRFLNIPKNPYKLADRIVEGRYSNVDVGKINNQYFINVTSMGIFTSVAHTTTKENKNLFGPLAYYIEGLKQFSSTNIPLAYIDIESEEFSFSGEFIIFLISNSSSIGGFHKMAPKACIDDGKFDCVLIRKAPAYKLFEIFLKVFNGQHINSEFVEYFQTNHISFDTKEEIDVDGEYHDNGKQTVKIIHNALKMII
ncbi:MAG: diacylglycerol kinase family protein [Bacillota bacterium]|nr:diacylglycerol kinase family protein [Bacillota bacterium]